MSSQIKNTVPLQQAMQSEAFCILPFIHLATRPGGRVKTCCNASKFSIGDLEENDDIKSLWNSKKMKDIRLNMLKGKKHKNCDRCFIEEKATRNSKRTAENEKWFDFYGSEKIIDILSKVDSDGSMPFHLKYFDFRPGTKCNLKCIICDPVNSSLWVKDYQKIHPKIKHNELKSDLFLKAKANYTWHKDPLFKKQLFSQLKNLDYLYIAGGEPFIIQDTYEVLEACIAEGCAKNINLRCNSNITKWRKDLFDLLKEFKSVKFFCSFDDIGKRNDYLRYPSQWSQIESALFEIDSQTPDNTDVFFDFTIQALNIYYVPDIIEWYFSKNFKKSFLEPHLLHYPSQLNPKVLPVSMKNLIEQRYNKLLDQLDSNQHKEIITHLQHSIQFMNNEDLSHRIPILKEYLDLLDHQRQTSFAETFPELKDIFLQGEQCA